MDFWDKRKKELLIIGDGLGGNTVDKILISEREILKEVYEDYIDEELENKFKDVYGLHPSWKERLKQKLTQIGFAIDIVDDIIKTFENEFLKFVDEIKNNSENGFIYAIERVLKEWGIK